MKCLRYAWILLFLAIIIPARALQLVGVPPDATSTCTTVISTPAVVASSGCLASDVTNGLQLHYSFDASNSLKVLDQSGHGYDGSVSGALWTVSGHTGGAYRFDSNAYISVGNIFDLTTNAMTSLTVSAWVQTPVSTSNREMMLIGKNQTDSPYRGWTLKTFQGHALAQLVATYPQEAYAYSTTPALSDGQWHHVCGIFEVGVSSLYSAVYVDGALRVQARRTGVHGETSTTAPLWIGLRAPSGSIPFTGLLDDVRIYDRVLSSNEIAVLSGTVTQSAPYVSYSVQTNGDCPRVLRRIWSATDACGDAVSKTQTVTVLDLTPPELTGVPADVTMPCGASSSAWPVVAAVDACAGSIAVSASEFVEQGCPGRIIRTWTSTDPCGNSVTATQVIKFVESTNPPVFLGVPSNSTVACSEVPPPPVVIATSLCSTAIAGDMILYYSFDQSNAAWVVDQSGHAHTGIVSGAQWVSGGRSGGAYEFDGDDRIAVGDVANLGGALTALTVSAWVQASSNAAVSEMMLAGRQQEASPYTGWSLRTFQTRPFADIIAEYPQRASAWASNTMADGGWHHVCGLFSANSNTMAVRLYVDGVLVNEGLRIGAHSTVTASAPLWLGARAPSGSMALRGKLDEVRVYARLLAEHEVGALADGGVPVAFSETLIPGCPRTIRRTWSAEDGCGQRAVATQLITVIDTEAPVLMGVPGPLNWTCTSPLPLPPLVTAYDACDGAVPASLEQHMIGTGCTAVVERLWSAVDLCGNASTATQFITLVSAGALPVLHGVPSNVTVHCGNIPPWPLVTATSACTASPYITPALYYSFDVSNELITLDQSGNNRNGIIAGARWISSGYRGGAYEFDGNDHISGGNLFDLGGERTAMTVSVWARIAAAPTSHEMILVAKQQEASPYTGWSMRTYLNQAMGDVIAAYPQRSLSLSSVLLADDLWHHVCTVFTVASNALRSIVYIDGLRVAEDERVGLHGDTATAAELWLGARSPGGSMSLVGSLDEVAIFERALSAAEVGALRSGGLQVLASETVTGSCPRIIRRKWSATDECGASVSATQQITVVDETPPVLQGVPPGERLTCGSPVPVAPRVQAIDDCGVTVSVAFAEAVTGTCPATITRRWTAMDACGNVSVATQLISFLPASTTNGLILRYRFAEPGPVAYDESGSGYHGAITGGVWIAASNCHDGALSFSGSGWVHGGSVADLGQARTSLTVLARIRGTPTGREMCIVGKEQDNVPYTGWSLRIAEQFHLYADLIASYPQRSFSSATNNILDGAWHVVGGVFKVTPDALSTKAILDGVVTAENSWLGAHATTAPISPFTVAARAPGYTDRFSGMIDEIRIYDRELSISEINAATFEMNACSESPVQVRCILVPDAAALAGGRWRVGGGTDATWSPSGASASVPAGLASIEFLGIQGWNSPSSILVNAGAGSDVVVTGRYTSIQADTQAPSIVDIQPPPGSVGLANSAVMNIFVTDNFAVSRVTVNGVEASELSPEHFHIHITGLRGLFNDFVVQVIDSAGNLTSTNVTYGQGADLDLRALWAGMWQVRNPHDGDVAFSWRVVGTGESGQGIVPAKSCVRFVTSEGPKVVEVLVGGVVVDSARSSQASAPRSDDDRDVDSDGDGMTNGEEDLAGTDTEDAASVLSLTRPVASGTVLSSAGLFGLQGPVLTDTEMDASRLVSFYSSSNNVYSLEYATNLGVWGAVLDFSQIPGVDGPLAYTNRFEAWPIQFRIKAAKRP